MVNEVKNEINPLNENIKQGRMDNKYTQDELAEKTHITRQTLSKYENGEQIPNADFLREFCKVCKKSADQILGISLVTTSGLSFMARNIAMAAEKLDPKTQEEILQIIKKLGNMLHFFI